MRRLAVLGLALIVAGGRRAPAPTGSIAAQPGAQARPIRWSLAWRSSRTSSSVSAGTASRRSASCRPAPTRTPTSRPRVTSRRSRAPGSPSGTALGSTRRPPTSSPNSGLPDLTVVVLSEGITPLAGDEHAHERATHEEGDEHGHAHAGGNPHLWLDPAYAVRYVERIRDALVEVDPANAESYRANAATYVGEINALDTWAKGEIATIPAERRKLVTFHDAFPYLAEPLRPGAGRRGAQESRSRALRAGGRDLVTEMRQHQIPTVYAEPQFNARILELAAKDAGVQVKRLYSDAFDDQVKTYLDLMRFNVTSLVEGLR